MVVVGIDIGLSGGIARLGGDGAEVWPMPTAELKVGGKVRRRVDPTGLVRILALDVLDPFCEAVAYVERAQASRQMGVSSAFSYGEGFGVVRGVLAQMGVRTELVTPVTWKRALGLVKRGSRELGRDEERDKAPALRLARKLYPELRDRLRLKKQDGLAEALLIARYGADVEGS